MANPQKENGFTPIANEIMEALYKTKLSGHELRLIMLVLRKTYGFHKKEDSISLSKMEQETGIHHIRCSQVITCLQLANILTVSENINGIGKKYRFNKDFDKWDTVSENIKSYKKQKPTVSENRSRPLVKTASTKDTLTKDTLTKEKIYIVEEVISYLNKKTGKSFSPKTKDTVIRINARIKEGRTVDDFQRVVDIKCDKWLSDPKMIDFLRPETLFGSKFEAYLNEKPCDEWAAMDKWAEERDHAKQ